MPKFREAGEAARAAAAFSPEPESGTVKEFLSSGPEMTSEPVDATSFTGEKTTVKFIAAPGVRARGAVEEETAKPEPETRSC